LIRINTRSAVVTSTGDGMGQFSAGALHAHIGRMALAVNRMLKCGLLEVPDPHHAEGRRKYTSQLARVPANPATH
jgi:hypothetical protein